MKVHVINSGSSGNCYLISDSQNNTLIVDAGKNTFENALAAIPNVAKTAAVIISHRHNDHMGDAEKWQKTGIKVYAPDNMEHAEQFNIACAGQVPFSVIPLSMEHDVPCFGFFIRANYDAKNLCFFTDCFSYARQIQALQEPLSLAMIEVNHDAHLLDTGKYPRDLKERVASTHCSVQRAALAIHGAKCTRFLLIHPSENNLDKEQALKQLCSEFPNREFTFALPGTILHV